jgi:hypothetical protein
MTRFQDGKPQTVWYSAHDVSVLELQKSSANCPQSGNTYNYDILTKNNGTRYIVYSALGGHPNYPVPGVHQRNETIIILNDTTSAGSLWDPIRSAYYFTFTPTEGKDGTFQAADPTPNAPVDWLHFLGRWGDKQYNDSNPIQFDFFGLEHTWDVRHVLSSLSSSLSLLH